MKNKIIEFRKNGLTYNEIQKITNCKVTDISKICRQNEIARYDNSINLDNELVCKLQYEYNNGLSLRNISKKYDTPYSIIRKYIKSNKSKMSDDDLKKNKSKSVINWRKDKKQKLVDYKGGECIICGYKKIIRSLEFHHVDPKEKDFTISGKSYSFDKLKDEVDKCILVCSNCHNEIHDNLYSDDEILTFFIKNKGEMLIKKEITDLFICSCGNKKDNDAFMCKSCYDKSQRIVERPPYEQLVIEIKEFGYKGTGRKYGVSDNSIRKWKKYYEKNNY